MNLVEMKQAVDMLYDEWDLGKTPSHSKGKVCAWIYLFEILEETEKMVIEKEDGKVIGICGYAKWNSKKHIIRKKVFHILKTILIWSPLVKDKKAIYKYNNDYDYDYTPKELANYLDIPNTDTIAIGNDYNDLSMFHECGYSVAVENASEDLKELVDYVTKSNDEDGVSLFLEKLINKEI